MIFLFGIGKSAHRQRGCVKTSYPYPRNLMFHWGKQPETTKICGGSGAKTLRSQNGFCMILSEHVLPHSIQWETNHHFFQRTWFFLGYFNAVLSPLHPIHLNPMYVWLTKPKMECKCQARPETTLVAPGAVSSSPLVRPGQYGGFYFGYLRICSNMFKHV